MKNDNPYTPIPKRGYIKFLPTGDVWVKYKPRHDDKTSLRIGGIIRLNKYPKYFIMENPYTKKSWSVQISENEFFVRSSFLPRLRTEVIKETLLAKYNRNEICEVRQKRKTIRQTPIRPSHHRKLFDKS